jgi:hypothetical protein
MPAKHDMPSKSELVDAIQEANAKTTRTARGE